MSVSRPIRGFSLAFVVALGLWLIILASRAGGGLLPPAGAWEGGTPSGWVIDALALQGDRLYAGGVKGLSLSRDGGRTWEPLAEVGEKPVTALAVAGETLLVATAEEVLELAGGSRRSGPLPSEGRVFKLLPRGDLLLAAGDGGFFSKPLAGSEGWRRLWPAEGQPPATVNFILPRGDGFLLGTNDGLVEGQGLDGPWTAGGLANNRVMSVAVAGGWMYAAIGEPYGGIVRTREGADEWKTANLRTNGAVSLVPHPREKGVVYAGLSGLAEQVIIAGVVVTRDGGESWEPIRTRLLNVQIPAMVFDESKDTIYAGTNGGGVFHYREPTLAHTLTQASKAYLDLLEPLVLGAAALFLLLSRHPAARGPKHGTGHPTV